MRIYAIALSSTWVLFAYASLGLRRNVKTIRQLIDPSSWTLRQWGIYELIAIAMFVAWGLLGAVLGRLLPARPGALKNIVVLLPGTLPEKLVWTVLSLSAGFCEEFVYRGYLLQQFFEWTRFLPAAIILKAVVYAAAHAALPWQVAVSVFFLGLLFGFVAAWKRTLIPGMLMHGVLDALAVVARR